MALGCSRGGSRHDSGHHDHGAHDAISSADQQSEAVPIDPDEVDEGGGHLHEAGVMESMAAHPAHLGPHFRWTEPRSATSADVQRAGDVRWALRRALERYRDYRVAIKDGYEPFLPNVTQAHYHFTNNWNALKGVFRFNPAEPTSLLYRRTATGYQLEGAMYTAPKTFSEDRLHQRIPLSVARWHAHVNICLPPKSRMNGADWRLFGFRGSIVTEAECTQHGGRFYPQVFGWMVHVYPFENSRDKVWTHSQH
jgi:hypothetical protein